MRSTETEPKTNGDTKLSEAVKTAGPRVNKGILLRPLTIEKLGRSAEYHDQMAETYKDDATLAATHTEAAKQLRELIAASPGMTALDKVLAKPRPMRRTVPVRRTVH